ncbi:hypothetical protein GUR47_01545 [Streptomyces tendae]|uniref:Uncharacterized protein n=1 Tax=Streptomyces tendae TaxID=1932 RepID=A0A6B3QEI7_STRTE|nr:hypothetical protein [Streptomyces tendae]NEV85377.1 hypothetical protein [Streptomyces tendae]
MKRAHEARTRQRAPSARALPDGRVGNPQTKLLAGRSISVPWGCELPKGEKLIQIEVAPDFDSETAIFTGPVT